jgi:Uma2 family endonuclease
MPALLEPAEPTRLTVERYFALLDEGVLDPQDRVELLEGVVVAMSPAGSRHATAVYLVAEVLQRALAGAAAVRTQGPLILGRLSAPEPDVAVVAGRTRDYTHAHPTAALLVVEVSDTTLTQDRITKSAIYAAGGVPEYWILNLREDCIEVHRAPDVASARYRESTTATASDRLTLVAVPGIVVTVSELLPER